MKRLLLSVFIFLSFFTLSLIFRGSAYSCGSCDVWADCQDCCENCTAQCSSVTGMCQWSVGNQCTDWCDNGNCNYEAGGWWINQICCDGYIFDTQVIACDPCGNGSCDTGEDCGSCEQDCGACCSRVPPGAPGLSFPAEAQSFTYNPAVAFQWSAPASWGEGCGNSLSYHLCVSDTNGGPCNRYDKSGIASSATSDATFVPIYNGTHHWRIAAVNNGQETWSGWRSFSVRVTPNCSNVSGPLEPKISVSSTYTADFSSPQNALTGEIFRTDLNPSNILINSAISGSSGSLTGSWTPVIAERGNKTIYCRAFNDGRSECRPPAFPTSPWPLDVCAGPTTSLNVCVEGYTSTNPAYVSNWSTWSACNNAGPNVHKRTRTRTCTEDCLNVTNDCDTYFADPASCPISGQCTFDAVTNIQTQTQDCEAVFIGRTYDASDCPPGICSCALSTPVGTGSAVIISPNYAWGLNSPTPINIDATGVFTFNAYLGSVNNNFPVDFTNLLNANQVGDATPKAYCPSQIPSYLGCDTGKMEQPCRPQIVPPDSVADVRYFDFGFYRKYGGWWQTVGGKVHADVDILSSIPASVDPLPYVPATSNQKLILDDANNRNGLLSYGNTFSMGSNPNALVSNSNVTFTHTYQGLTYNYDYFNAKFNANENETWDAGNTPPAYEATGNGFMLLRYTGPLPLSLNSFNVANGEKYVVLVPGPITVNGDITVDVGGHLTFISTGDIHFSQTSTTAEGWYLTDGMIYVDSTGDELTDQQFEGNGSFVGWNGFSLNRNRGFTNNKFPAELFTYREDLIENAPELLKFPYKYYSPYNP